MFKRYSDRARQLLFIALWSARNRGGSYIEPEDLLHALIREDRGEFVAFEAEILPETPGSIYDPGGGHRPFFADEVARKLLRELHEDTDPLRAETPTRKPEPVPHVELPMSHSLERVLRFAAKAHATAIEPLHLLAAMVEDRDSSLAQLLRDHGITRQTVAKALDSGT